MTPRRKLFKGMFTYSKIVDFYEDDKNDGDDEDINPGS